MPNDDNKFTTEDIDLASYVFSQTLLAPAIERNGRRCLFKFPSREAAEAVARKFGESESCAFARARRTLNWELHRVREQGGDAR